MSSDKTQRTRGRLKLSNSKLDWILEITNAINNNSSKEELFNILTSILINELNIGKFVLFTYEGEWRISLTEGVSIDQIDVDINNLVGKYKSIDVIASNTKAGLDGFDVVIPVYHKNHALAYLLLADLDGEKIEISPIIKHLRFIQTMANIIVVALENKRLNKEYIKQFEIRKELELAQKMQSLLFPRKLPDSSEISIKANYLPHSEVGGDYYDVIPLNDGKVAFCVADVSGKGISAALLMANFQAHLRARLPLTKNLVDLIKHCNGKIIESANYEKFITLFIAVFDPKKKKISYLNAGHPPAILFQNGRSQLLKEGCTVLGMFEELPEISSSEVTIEPNSQLICYTDGLTEMENKSGEAFEMEGILNLIENKANQNNINLALSESINRLKQESTLSDDITLLTAQFFSQSSASNSDQSQQ